MAGNSKIHASFPPHPPDFASRLWPSKNLEIQASFPPPPGFETLKFRSIEVWMAISSIQIHKILKTNSDSRKHQVLVQYPAIFVSSTNFGKILCWNRLGPSNLQKECLKAQFGTLCGMKIKMF